MEAPGSCARSIHPKIEENGCKVTPLPQEKNNLYFAKKKFLYILSWNS
jgi:hypothetical protein